MQPTCMAWHIKYNAIWGVHIVSNKQQHDIIECIYFPYSPSHTIIKDKIANVMFITLQWRMEAWNLQEWKKNVFFFVVWKIIFLALSSLNNNNVNKWDPYKRIRQVHIYTAQLAYYNSFINALFVAFVPVICD